MSELQLLAVVMTCFSKEKREKTKKQKYSHHAKCDHMIFKLPSLSQILIGGHKCGN